MNKPILMIMAAGMASRYGSLKQIDPIDEVGNVIMDFSIYDAKEAGFEKVVFIIKREHLQEFKDVIGDRVSKFIDVEYAFQDINNIPESCEIPEGREKPWGTAHAIYSAKDVIDGPFAVINADDYYGKDAFGKMYDFLKNQKDDDKYRYCMVGYKLLNTVTENGTVSRGICDVNSEGFLDSVVERTKIAKFEDGIKYTEDEDEKEWNELHPESIVSMNMWGFSESLFKAIEEGMPEFFEKVVSQNPLKGEYLLPTVVSTLIKSEKATVKVLNSEDKWYGVTYKEDKPVIVKAVKELKEKGVYPEGLWR